MIIKELTKWQFQDAFRDMGRGEQFSIQGLNALYDYLDDLSESMGEPIELDVIALCCEYTEYDDLEELLEACDYIDAESVEDVLHYTEVIEVDGGGYIIRDF